MTGHFYSPLLICVSGEVFDALSPEEQQILSEAAVEAGKACRENNARVEEQMLSEMEEQGMTVVRDVVCGHSERYSETSMSPGKKRSAAAMLMI